MVVAQPGDDVRQLDVERVVGEFVDLAAQDAQPLHGIESVARALQRQVGVDAFEHPLDAVDEPQPFGGGQRSGRQERTGQRLGRRRGRSAARLGSGSDSAGEGDASLGFGNVIGCHRILIG